LFDNNTPVKSYNPYRNHHFTDEVRKNLGSQLVTFLQSPVLIFSILTSRFLRLTTPPLYSFRINPKEITKIKELELEKAKSNKTERNSDKASKDVVSKSSDTPSFLSTNDILTSWFFRAVNCDYGMMAINYRNRVPPFDDQLVGNYENMIFYAKTDFQNPLQIRKSLKTIRSESQTVPTLYDAWKYNWGLVSNWSSFYKEVLLGGEKHRLLSHSPLMQPANMVMKAGTMIIYCPRKGELAVYIMSRQLSEKQWLQRGSFLESFNK
jgi:hypothetical protein